jgi:MFS superfamily sulfate permease-like transporter
MTSGTEPVKAVLLDLGATTDLDAPSAEMLAELGEELHNHDVRFMLLRVIAPVRQMLEVAGAMEKIKLEDVFVGPTEAIVALLSSHYDEAGIQELLQGGAETIRALLQASLTAAPVERRDTITAVLDTLDQAIKEMEIK